MADSDVVEQFDDERGGFEVPFLAIDLLPEHLRFQRLSSPDVTRNHDVADLDVGEGIDAGQLSD